MSQNREGFNPNFPNTGTGSGSGSDSTAPGSTGPGSSSSGIGSSSYNSSTPGGTGSGTTGTATALSQTGHKISEAATQAKDYVSDKVSVVGDKLKELQNADIGEVAENAKEYARKNPGQAILISAAAGLVLGLILRGRRQ